MQTAKTSLCCRWRRSIRKAGRFRQQIIKSRSKFPDAGKLIGVGNGDPNCQESDKAPKRSLFNGLAQVIVQSTKRPGAIHIVASKDGWEGPDLTSATLLITAKPAEPRRSVPGVREI